MRSSLAKTSRSTSRHRGYDPETATGNVIVAVPDVDELYGSFASGLRSTFGKLPAAGIPRIIARAAGSGRCTDSASSIQAATGCVLHLGDTEEAAEKRTGLLRVVDNAARQGTRMATSTPPSICSLRARAFRRRARRRAAEALLYRAELAARLGRPALAGESLGAHRACRSTSATSCARLRVRPRRRSSSDS